MGKGRANIFAEADEAEEVVPIDLSEFAPQKPTAPARPTQQQVKAVSEAANFPSRESAKSPPRPKREPRRHRTGRNVQFNAKASQETIDRFYAITAQNEGWVLGYTLERAVAALELELRRERENQA
jgi:hypothetical protein